MRWRAFLLFLWLTLFTIAAQAQLLEGLYTKSSMRSRSTLSVKRIIESGATRYVVQYSSETDDSYDYGVKVIAIDEAAGELRCKATRLPLRGNQDIESLPMEAFEETTVKALNNGALFLGMYFLRGGAIMSEVDFVGGKEGESAEVMSKPNPFSKAIGSLKSGTRLDVKTWEFNVDGNEYNDWAQIEVKGKKGFIHANNVIQSSAAVILGDNVNFRAEPSQKAAVLMQFKKYTEVQALDLVDDKDTKQKNVWQKVWFNHKLGFVSSIYVPN